MGEASFAPWQRVLRVIQLDSSVLDEEVLLLLQSRLKHVLKYFQGGVLRWQPELNLLVRLILWRFTVYENSATIGQSLFSVKYGVETSKGCKPISTKHKLLIGSMYVLKHWVSERLDDFMTCIDQYPVSEKIRKALKWLDNFWQLASVVNFVVFLQDGVYVSLFERLFGLRHIYYTKQRIRKGSYEYMNRELLWHGCAEFIFFLIPLINIQKLKNMVKRFSNPNQGTVVGKSNVIPRTCPICEKNAIHPHTAPCGHIYCYYCIKSNCLADSAFKCITCNTAVNGTMKPLAGKLAK